MYAPMIDFASSIIVLLTGGYLISLSVFLLLLPTRGKRFLGGFASSAFTHYLEILLRFVSGGAILLYAPYMLFPNFFVIFGWILVLTTIGLCAIPWQWHRRFAQWAVPYAIRHLWLVAVASFIFGGIVLASVILGNETEKLLSAPY
jgi:hypothetical protein